MTRRNPLIFVENELSLRIEPNDNIFFRIAASSGIVSGWVHLTCHIKMLWNRIVDGPNPGILCLNCCFLNLKISKSIVDSDSCVVPVVQVSCVVHPKDAVIRWLEIYLLFETIRPVRTIISPVSVVMFRIPCISELSQYVNYITALINQVFYIEETVGMSRNKTFNTTIYATCTGHWIVLWSPIPMSWFYRIFGCL